METFNYETDKDSLGKYILIQDGEQVKNRTDRICWRMDWNELSCSNIFLFQDETIVTDSWSNFPVWWSRMLKIFAEEFWDRPLKISI